MTPIDISKWVKFKICDLFYVCKGTTLSIENKIAYEGDIACINGSSLNNGILTYLDKNIEKIGFKLQKAPALSMSRVGNSGLTFYQSEDFFIADNAYSLKLKDIRHESKNVYLFLATILNKSIYKYSYGRIINSKYFQSYILLPNVENGDIKVPNYEYMNDYVNKIEDDIQFEPINTSNNRKVTLDCKAWNQFKITDLFDIKGYGSISSVELESKGVGEYPYVTRTEQNNGISGFYDYKTAPKNVLTIETTLSGLCFYHDYEFSTGDHIMVLEPKEGVVLNKYTAMFIKTIWRKNSYKYDYNRPAIKENIVKTSLILPSKNGKPDWDYMGKFIKKLPYGDLI